MNQTFTPVEDSFRQGLHILLVDDDPINNMICEELLNISSYAAKVTSFLEPLLALEWLEQQAAADWPDLILLDINMPILDGWQFLDELNLQVMKRPLRVKILSSSLSECDQTRAKTYKLVDDYLVKPLCLKRLQSAPERMPSVDQTLA